MNKKYDLTGLRILFIDDEVSNFWAMAASIKHKGAEIITTNSGPQVYELIFSGTFDVILLDFSMPEISGMDILRATRTHSDPAVNSITIVAFTAKTSSEDRKEMLEEGCDYYFAKPVSVTMLTAYLEPIAVEKRKQALKQK